MLSSFNSHNFYEILNSYSTVQLEQMTKQYPFQHELHLLLAKKYQLEKNPAFDEQLQLAAIYAQDRELFFSLFNEAVPQLTEVKSELYEEQVAEATPFVLPEEAVAESEEPVVAPVEEEQQVFPVETEETQAEELPIQLEAETEVAPTEVSERTFDEWLHLFKRKETVVVTEEVTAEEQSELPQADDELNRLILANTPVDFLHELVKEETHYSKGLDVFIEIQKSRKKQPEVKKPVQENEIDPDMVTETLAKLYEMQKKYTRAIRAYEALSLKYPEKSDLFAARINYLKNIV